MGYIIVDWKNDRMFRGIMFDSINEVEEFISEIMGDNYDDDREEYYIVENEE